MKRNGERRNLILSMAERGMTYSEIATLLGVSRGAVAGVVCRDRTTEPSEKKVQHARPVCGAESIVQAARAVGLGHTKFRISIEAELVDSVADDAPQAKKGASDE